MGDGEWFLPLDVGVPWPIDPWVAFLRMWNDIGIRVAVDWLHEDIAAAIRKAMEINRIPYSDSLGVVIQGRVL